MALMKLKELYLAPRTEEERDRGTLLGFLIYCSVCDRVVPDTNVVILNCLTPTEAFGRCETCGTQHEVQKSGTLIWYEKERGPFGTPKIRGVLQARPGDEKFWEEMVHGRERAKEFAKASQAVCS